MTTDKKDDPTVQDWAEWLPAAAREDDALLTGFRLGAIPAAEFRETFRQRMADLMASMPLPKVVVYNGAGVREVTPGDGQCLHQHGPSPDYRIGPLYPIDSFADYVTASLPPDLESQPTTAAPCEACGQPNDYARRTEIHFLQLALTKRNRTISQLKQQLVEVGKMLATEKRSNAFFRSTLDIAVKRQSDDALHIAQLSKQVERRHDSSCSKEGERACETCPECHLGAHHEPDVTVVDDDREVQ